MHTTIRLNRIGQFALILMVLALIGLLYWPTFRWLFLAWLSSPYYSHGFLIPIVTGVLIWNKRGILNKGRPSSVGIIVLLVAALLCGFSFFYDMRFLTAISLIVLLTSLFIMSLGMKATQAIAFPLAFLVFMVPLPFVEKLGYFMQTISVHSSSFILKVVGLHVSHYGDIIQLGSMSFTVGLVCSGLNSLIALFALTSLYAYLLKGSVFRRSALVFFVFPIAMLANSARIASVILVANYFSVDVAVGTYHDISSVLFFVPSCLVLVLISRFMGCRLTIGK